MKLIWITNMIWIKALFYNVCAFMQIQSLVILLFCNDPNKIMSLFLYLSQYLLCCYLFATYLVEGQSAECGMFQQDLGCASSDFSSSGVRFFSSSAPLILFNSSSSALVMKKMIISAITILHE